MKEPKYSDYKLAHDEAFSPDCPIFQPCIAWHRETGFEVVSKTHIENGYRVDWFIDATIDANTGAERPSAHKSVWPRIARMILEATELS